MKKILFVFSLGWGALASAQMNDTPAPATPATPVDQATPTNTPVPTVPATSPDQMTPAAPTATPSAPATEPIAQPTAPSSPTPAVEPAPAPAPKHHSTRAARALEQLVNQPKFITPTVGYKEGDTSGADYWIAHRCVDDFDGSGWGWVHKKGDDWGDAIWVALKENPGVVVAPFRHLTKRDGDNNWEFKFWGHMANYKAYDAHLNEKLPVFVLEGYEVTGSANPLSLKPGPRDRRFHGRSTASSRDNRPIQNSPDE